MSFFDRKNGPNRVDADRVRGIAEVLASLLGDGLRVNPKTGKFDVAIANGQPLGFTGSKEIEFRTDGETVGIEQGSPYRLKSLVKPSMNVSMDMAPAMGRMDESDDALEALEAAVDALISLTNSHTDDLSSIGAALAVAQGQISALASTQATHSGQITTLQGQVAANTSAIATNASAITALQSSVATLTTNLAATTALVNSVNAAFGNHHARHEPGGADAMTVDATPTVGSLRTVQFNTTAAFPGNSFRVVTLNGATTVTADTSVSTRYVVNLAGGSVTLNLPVMPASPTGREVSIMIGSVGLLNGLTVTPGSGLIEGLLSYVVSGLGIGGQFRTWTWTGTTWMRCA